MCKLGTWERDMAAETAAWAAFGGARDDWIKQGSGSRVLAFHWLRDVALRWLRKRQGV